MKVLGIETSCDDCCVAVVENGIHILSNIKLSQKEHEKYYGVVPEIASRLHTEAIMSVCIKALKKANTKISEIDLIAVTSRPGLIGSLIVGLNFAKGLAISLKKPIICIDHILGHLYAPLMHSKIEYPFISLLLSGGHTLIAKQKNFDDVEILGRTLDDSCGEAFDKVAKHYDMGFPGGPNIEQISKNGDENTFKFPVTTFRKKENWYDFSYSGLKTACIHQLEKFKNKDNPTTKNNIAASFQKAAFENLITPLKRAIKDTQIKKLVIAGGVASNLYLREKIDKLKIQTYYPPLDLCTDNGAMIAGLGFNMYLKYGESPIEIEANSRIENYKNQYKGKNNEKNFSNA
ncbi:tRNA (adenosine(37)-N6)-threonylcarbamoyltransferase complex transferase subunit TsaD [Borreliella afzelii]|uniref:tRNA N6-adenosine threonylcarbamoyltransferase n=1 Tax=Borreliella afzelii TaxID=29518 RepID=A0AB34Z1E4_BORAF|nr:tRNA (adenosine(37)-N6)-threonylcarbamoyltransferase complex transferase subunit TsaD [Borreliella afzelii]APJ08378.1 tRNA (adenosine(37)-N6)-threonylcarbamoyltransferase complex transferase subunit TsaD [Borreliella afzelii]MBB5140694.1 N6-L-threonylcarbamoyladenine synthase [Borreliella afzelii]